MWQVFHCVTKGIHSYKENFLQCLSRMGVEYLSVSRVLYIQLTKIPITRTTGLREGLKRKHMKKAGKQVTINYHVVVLFVILLSISIICVRK